MKEKKEVRPSLKKEKTTIYKMLLCAFALFCFTAVANATVNVQIDSPTNGATISKDDYVQLTGTASATGGKGIDIVLVVDNSSSLRESDPANWRNAAIHDLIYSFDDNTDVSIGMVSFASTANSKTVVNLGLIKDVRNAFDPALKDMDRNQEGTAIGEGINIARKLLESKGRANASKVIIIFTDGNNNEGLDPSSEASAAKAAGVRVSVITLASASCPNLPEAFQWACTKNLSGVKPSLNEAIAQAGGGSHFTADNHKTLIAYLGSPLIVDMDKVEIINETTGRAPGSITFVAGSFAAQVPIADGENKLLVTAYSTSGESAKATVTIKRQGTIPPPDETPVASVKLRPQIIAAGFDPMILDVTTTKFKVLAIVREGALPIHQVTLITNKDADSGIDMALGGKLPNGDLVYELKLNIPRGLDFSYTGIFGPEPDQFNIKVLDTQLQQHRFPTVEYGNNNPLTSTKPSNNATEYKPDACKRLLPQVLMAGFDPPLHDWNETNFGVIAIVRDGVVPIKDVTLNLVGTVFSPDMNFIENLPNGDKLYKVTMNFPRGSFSAMFLRTVWGPEDSQFLIKVRDNAMQEYSFPDLRRGQYPASNQAECKWCDLY